MKKISVRLILCASLLLSASVVSPVSFGVCAAESNTLSYFFFDDDSAYVDGGTVTGDVTVPVTIPNPNGGRSTVVGIAADAFRGSSITSVKLPYTIEWVGDGAFSDCVALTSVDFSTASVSLGSGIFSGDSDVVLTGTDNVVYAGKNALNGTNYLNSFAEDEDIYIGKCLYRGASTGDVTLKDGTLSVAPEAFKDNTQVFSVRFGDSCRIIGDSAFAGCNALYTVYFGNSLAEIRTLAFDGSAIMGYPAFPTSLKEIGAYAFRNCTNLSGVELYDAEGLTSISAGAFYGCTSLVSVTLCSTVTSIGDNCFAGDVRLSEISCTGLTHIGNDAFRNCSALVEDAVFWNVTEVGTGAFDGTALLEQYEGMDVIIGSALYRIALSEENDYYILSKTVTPRAGVNCTMDYLFLSKYLRSVGEKALPTNDNTTIVSVSEYPTVYEYFDGLPYKALYLPSDVLSERPERAEYITGMEIATLPEKMDYKPDESFEEYGVMINLLTESGKKLPINDYTIRYDFSVSNKVTFSCGRYSAVLAVNVLSDAKPGDLDGNGEVDSVDLFIMRQYLSGLISENDFVFAAGDTDGNGSVDSADLVTLRKMLSGL